MPYLSWLEGGQLMRYALHGACQVGRDPLMCSLAQPNHVELSRAHASIDRIGGIWWVRDLDSANGTLLNAQPLHHPQGDALQDGDELVMGGWHLTFTEGFPGLDGTTFAELADNQSPQCSVSVADSPITYLPGFDHCGIVSSPGVGLSGSSGPGASHRSLDPLPALEKWVEEGVAPESILMTRRDKDDHVEWARPVCVYPEMARYKGSGAWQDAANWACTSP